MNSGLIYTASGLDRQAMHRSNASWLDEQKNLRDMLHITTLRNLRFQSSRACWCLQMFALLVERTGLYIGEATTVGQRLPATQPMRRATGALLRLRR